MKFSSQQFFLGTIILCLLTISCQAQKIKIGSISNGKPSMVLDKVKMSKAVEALLDNGTIVNSTEIMYSAKGKFHYLYSEGTLNNKKLNIAVSLTDINGNLYYTTTDCTHECESNEDTPCSGGCNMNIKEKCKVLECHCNQPGGTCDSSITTSKELSANFLSFFKDIKQK